MRIINFLSSNWEIIAIGIAVVWLGFAFDTWLESRRQRKINDQRRFEFDEEFTYRIGEEQFNSHRMRLLKSDKNKPLSEGDRKKGSDK